MNSLNGSLLLMLVERLRRSSVRVKMLVALGAVLAVFVAGPVSGVFQFVLFFALLCIFFIFLGAQIETATLAVAILLVPFEIGFGMSIPTVVLEGYSGLKEFSTWFLVSYADIVLSFLLLGLMMSKAYRLRYRTLYFDWALLIFVVWAFISTLASPYQPAATTGWATLVKGMVSYVIIRLLPISRRLHKTIAMCFSAILFFQGALGLYQLRMGDQTGRFFEATRAIVDGAIYRPSGTLYDPNNYALFLLMVLPVVVTQLLNAQSLPVRFFMFLSVLMGFLGIIVSGGRVAWGTLALYGLYLWKYYPHQIVHFMKSKLYYPNGNKLMILGVIVLVAYLYPKIIAPRISGLPSVFAENGTLSSRLLLVRESFALIARHPIVGTGLNGFSAGVAQEPITDVFRGFTTEVHNIYLLIASELGVVGLLLFLLVLRPIITEFGSLGRASPERTSYGISIGIFLVFGFMIPSFIRGAQFPLFMLMVGLFVRSK